MLTEYFGLTYHESDEPYYKDVDPSNDYFTYVQSGYEYGIFPKENDFSGDQTVDGKYAAVSALKAIGRFKVQLYLGMTEEPTDADYFALAKKEKLLTADQVMKPLTEEECTSMLARADELYWDELWRDVSEVTYQEDVKKLREKDVVTATETEVVLPNNSSEKLEVGDKIVYPIPGEEILASGIVSQTNGNVITMEEAGYDEILESAIASEKLTITAEDLFAANGITEAEASLSYLERPAIGRGFVAAKDAPLHTKTLEGFEVSFEMDENDQFHIEVDGKDIDSKVEMSDPEEENDAAKAINKTSKKAKFSIAVEDIEVGVQYIYNQLEQDRSERMEYLNITTESDIKVAGELSVEKDILIPLGIGINKGIGKKDEDGKAFASLTFGLFIKISAEGEVSLEVSFPVQSSFEYIKGKAPVFHPPHKVGEPEISFEAKCKLGFYPLVPKIELVLFHTRIVNLELDAGVEAEADAIFRDSKDLIFCVDMTLYAPAIKIEVESDIIPSLKKGKKENLSIEHYFIRNEVLQKHLEVLRTGEANWVDPCSYKRQNRMNPDTEDAPETEDQNDIELVNTYQTRYAEVNQVSAPVFYFDYPEDWQITEEYIQQDVSDFVDERDVLTNERGVTITFTSLNHKWGLNGHELYLTQTETVAPSQFQPIEDWDDDGEKDIELGTMTVQQGRYVGYCGPEDEDFVRYDDGPEFYLVAPESMTLTEQTDWGNLADTYGWAYPAGGISIIAESPDGTYTDQERQEIIAILSSFR